MMLRSDMVPLPIEDPRLQWEARQVLRDRRGVPHLFLRLRLKGGHFPRRGVSPFAQVGSVRSVFVEISSDEESAHAYFDRPLPDGAAVEFGFGPEVILRFARPFRRIESSRLDRRIVPAGTRNLDRFCSTPAVDAA